MVEFAMILPILALLLSGAIEIGFAFKQELLVDNPVQVAARTDPASSKCSNKRSQVFQARGRNRSPSPDVQDQRGWFG